MFGHSLDDRKYQQVKRWLEELETPSKTLTAWEESFFLSVKDQFNRTGYLSERQLEILERIYADKTD